MSFRNYTRKKLSALLQKYIAADNTATQITKTHQKILVIRQHNQFGDQLASVSLLRALKETYPHCLITLVASKENYYAVQKNEFVDELIVFDKRKFWNPFSLSKFRKLLKQNYDLAIVPATVAVSSTSCILAGLSDAKIKIGPKSLAQKENPYAFVFHYQIDLDWQRYPDAHVSDFILDIVRPFGIKTKNFSTSISFGDEDIKYAKTFHNTIEGGDYKYLIGFHVGAGKPENRWSLKKYCELIEQITAKNKIKFYFTGSDTDAEEIAFMKKYFDFRCGYYLKKTIPQLAALISISDLFITNDTGVMHVAGATIVPQISIFGPTNPFNWSPVGPQKYFIRKSEFIDDIKIEDVFNLFLYIQKKHLK